MYILYCNYTNSVSYMYIKATSCPKVPKELAALKTKNLEWSSFHVDPTSRLPKASCSFYNGKWYDVPVVLSISSESVALNNVLNNHFTMTKVTEFVTRVEKEYCPAAENERGVYALYYNAMCRHGVIEVGKRGNCPPPQIFYRVSIYLQRYLLYLIEF